MLQALFGTAELNSEVPSRPAPARPGRHRTSEFGSVVSHRACSTDVLVASSSVTPIPGKVWPAPLADFEPNLPTLFLTVSNGVGPADAVHRWGYVSHWWSAVAACLAVALAVARRTAERLRRWREAQSSTTKSTA